MKIIDIDLQKSIIGQLKDEILFAIRNAEENHNVIQVRHMRKIKFLFENLDKEFLDYIEKKNQSKDSTEI